MYILLHPWINFIFQMHRKLVILWTALVASCVVILLHTQNRHATDYFFPSRTINFRLNELIDSPSFLYLNEYLRNKVILIDPRLISTRQGKDQIRIGEERLADIFELNGTLMAFFERDRLEIMYLLKKHKLQWKNHAGDSFEVNLHGKSYHLVSFSPSETEDYYEFVLQNVTRIIPRFDLMLYNTGYGIFTTPANWTIFEWNLRRSRFVSCRQDYAKQYRKVFPELFTVKPKIPEKVIQTLQKFRNWAVEHGGTPMLFSGTLLGWYRECGIITHTHDIDFALFIEEYYDDFAKEISQSSFMQLARRFNKPEDLLEYRVYIMQNIPMDIFFLYHDQNNSWVGGWTKKKNYRYDYPVIDKVCATDLLGYLMYVPCNPIDVIEGRIEAAAVLKLLVNINQQYLDYTTLRASRVIMEKIGRNLYILPNSTGTNHGIISKRLAKLVTKEQVNFSKITLDKRLDQEMEPQNHTNSGIK